MDGLAALFAVAAALALGVMSPGPSFIVVARTSIAKSRRAGVLAALGMGVGGGLFAIAAMLGLKIVITTLPTVYKALQMAGAAYLLFIAYQLWVHAPEPMHMSDMGGHSDPPQSRNLAWYDVLKGLATQVSNPKTAIVYTSVFSAAMPAELSQQTAMVLLVLVFLIEFGWYALVAVAFSSSRARAVYLRSKTWIDRLAATAMGALGAKILADSRFA